MKVAYFVIVSVTVWKDRALNISTVLNLLIKWRYKCTAMAWLLLQNAVYSSTIKPKRNKLTALYKRIGN